MESRCPLILIVIQLVTDTLLSRRTKVIYLSCAGHTSEYEGNVYSPCQRQTTPPTSQTNQVLQPQDLNSNGKFWKDPKTLLFATRQKLRDHLAPHLFDLDDAILKRIALLKSILITTNTINTPASDQRPIPKISFYLILNNSNS